MLAARGLNRVVNEAMKIRAHFSVFEKAEKGGSAFVTSGESSLVDLFFVS